MFEALLRCPACRDCPVADGDGAAVAGCVTGDQLYEGVGGIGAALTAETRGRAFFWRLQQESNP